MPESGDDFDEVLIKDWLKRETGSRKYYIVEDDLDEDKRLFEYWW